MRFMLISDIHGSMDMAESAGREAERRNVDIVLVAGDITHFGGPSEARRILSAIPVRKVAVPGNCDPPEIVDIFQETGTESAHGKRVELEDICFAGLGAANPMPFSTLFTYSEENIHMILDAIMDGCDVMITHTPPMGILDRTTFGHLGGSVSIRKVVERYGPALHVFGHIHESPGYERIGETVFVNAGAAKDGNAAIIDVEKEERLKVKNIERIRLFP